MLLNQPSFPWFFGKSQGHMQTSPELVTPARVFVTLLCPGFSSWKLRISETQNPQRLQPAQFARGGKLTKPPSFPDKDVGNIDLNNVNRKTLTELRERKVKGNRQRAKSFQNLPELLPRPSSSRERKKSHKRRALSDNPPVTFPPWARNSIIYIYIYML